MLRFPDGIQWGVIGLDDILADVYSEGKQMSEETPKEIVDRVKLYPRFLP